MADAGKNSPDIPEAELPEKKKFIQEIEDSDGPECAVCLQPCVHPAELPCHHVFCYLCVKGVANQSKRCPMCRHEIPQDFLERPRLVDFDELEKSPETAEEEYRWFYEGRNGLAINEIITDYNSKQANLSHGLCSDPHGWWQYDERTSSELETAFKEGKSSCELLIAGFLYVADFGCMLQLRRNDPSRRRKIKRDLFNIPKKGVAGLRLGEIEETPIVREIRGAERPASPTNDEIDIT